MILVTLGTQDKSFIRLLKAIDKQIKKGNIKEEVIVQAGTTKYESKNMIIKDLIPVDEFNNLVKQCNILITHGGVGSIMTGLQNNKVLIVAPRLKKYKEHVNDHQLQIIESFSKEHYIIPLLNFNKLDEALELAKTFKPNKYKSNTKNVIKLLDDYILNNTKKESC